MNILEMLRPMDKTALIQNQKRISYTELMDHGLRFGGYLKDKGIKKGDYVLVFTPLSVDLYIAMMGAWSIGAVPIFIDFSRGTAFVNDSIQRLKPRIIVCDSITHFICAFYSKPRKIQKIRVQKRGDAVTPLLLEEEHPAILSFTSGSTGVPKIAVRTHGFLIDQYHALIQHMDFSETQIDLGTLPVFTLANLASGMTTLLPRKSYLSKTDGKDLAKQIKKEKISRIICSPALMSCLLQYGDFPTLSHVYLGGGPVYPRLLEKIPSDVDLHIVYGSTEAEPISGIRWKEVSEADRMKIKQGKGLPVGRVVLGVECRIGENQEIQVSGKTVLKGYMDGIGDNENKIREKDKVWHKTGDAGYFDEQGCLWLLGRVSQAIHDEKGSLYPFSVECILDAEFGIRGAVLLRNDKRVVVIDDPKIDPSAVLQALEKQQIDQVISIREIPMDKRHNAKIDYHRLEKLLD